MSDAISLSDEDIENYIEEKTENCQREFYESDVITPKPKRRKISNNNGYCEETNLTAKQEKILTQCYEEFPAPFPELLNELTKDTGLSVWQIKNWYNSRTESIFQLIFSSFS